MSFVPYLEMFLLNESIEYVDLSLFGHKSQFMGSVKANKRSTSEMLPASMAALLGIEHQRVFNHVCSVFITLSLFVCFPLTCLFTQHAPL